MKEGRQDKSYQTSCKLAHDINKDIKPPLHMFLFLLIIVCIIHSSFVTRHSFPRRGICPNCQIVNCPIDQFRGSSFIFQLSTTAEAVNGIFHFSLLHFSLFFSSCLYREELRMGLLMLL